MIYYAAWLTSIVTALDVHVEAVSQCSGTTDSSVDSLTTLQDQTTLFRSDFVVRSDEVGTSLDNRVIDERKDFFQRQAVGLITNDAGDAGNKQREELVGVRDCASRNQIEANIGGLINIDVAAGSQSTGASYGEGC